MKSMIVMVLTLLLMFSGLIAVGCDGGSVLNGEQMNPDSVHRLEAAGWDLRIYEFTPESAPEHTCVFAAGNRKGGLDCFPKVTKQ